MGELTLATITDEFAAAFMQADARGPAWKTYLPGLGPHAENKAVALVLDEISQSNGLGGEKFGQSLAFPDGGKRRCDMWIGVPTQWAIEVKMARFRGNNGKPDDTAIKDILSPYDSDRSALTDTTKLASAGFTCKTAVLIYGFDYSDRPLEPVIAAFELLARKRVDLGVRHEAPLHNLVHPVHIEGRVFAWEVKPK